MITVFGSINVDMVLKVMDLPAPGETVLCPSYKLVAGGKGANQAVAAARAGSKVRFVGCVGEDEFAEIALNDLQAADVNLSDLRRTASPTACAAVMVDDEGENSIVVASGANQDARAAQISKHALGAKDLLVLQMEVPFTENWAAVAHARSVGARIILSVAPAAPVPADILDQVDYILVNEHEGRSIAEASGVPVTDRGDLPQLLAQKHNTTCIMTLGSHGLIAANADEDWHIPALPLDAVVDTTGAGDAFAGCFAAALEQGLAFDYALRFASTGAGLSCLTLGAQPSFPSGEAILSALQ